MAGGRITGRWRDHRQVIDGILHRVRTGVQWHDLPERFGPWKTVYERHRLWSADGTWERLLQQVQAAADAVGERPRTPGRNAVAQPARPLGGGGAGGEGLGRSRGGFTTKLHLNADGRCRLLSLIGTPGQRADCTQFKPVLEKIRVPRSGPGRPRKKPDSVAADKAYSNGPCRECLRRRGIRHTIPEKTDSQAARLRKGRNTVERAINRLKQHRAVATRYHRHCGSSNDWLRT
ncbi:DDE family transposase [Streptomyces sp. 3211.6]|nr:DDE family transposase [Streptomyces sp. 3211.6]